MAEYFIVRIAFTCGLIQRSAAIMLIAVAERHYSLREWRWILEKLSTAAAPVKRSFFVSLQVNYFSDEMGRSQKLLLAADKMLFSRRNIEFYARNCTLR